MKKNAVVMFIALATIVSLLAVFGCLRDKPELAVSPQIEQPMLGAGDISDESYAKFRSSVSMGQSLEPDPTISIPMPQEKVPPAFLPEVAPSTITPASLELYMREGDCEHITKEVVLPEGESITRADILFALDLTGSMGDELDQVKIQIQNIADQLATLIDEPAFGVVSYMDYPGVFSYCGYVDSYGSGPDYAYNMDQAIDPDVNLTKTAVNGLTLGYGDDGPESYARVLYESYSDASIGWRAGARRIIVNFGDNVPHDCDVGSCLSMAMGSTGIDPGRDATAGTPDDLPIMDVLSGMSSNSVALFMVYSGDFPGSDEQYQLWQCWAAATSGVAVRINGDGSVPGGMSLADLIYEQVQPVFAHCDKLTLGITPGFEDWMQNLTPPEYDDVFLPTTVSFDLDICVPPGTPEGMYIFNICAYCDLAEKVCETDTVHVLPPFTPYLDIHPRSCPNPINIDSPGLTPAALLGTREFHPRLVNPSTLRLEGVAPIRWQMEDVARPRYHGEGCECNTGGPDGFRDLTLKFNTPDLVAALGDVTEGQVITLTITGELWDHTPFEATDCVVIRGAKEPDVDFSR